MKTFTTYAEKKAKQIFNLLQGYTKGIRMTAILILLLMGVGNAWGETVLFLKNTIPFNNGRYAYFYTSSYWDGNNGAGSNSIASQCNSMTKLGWDGQSDIYVYQTSSNYKYVAIMDHSQYNYGNFWQTQGCAATYDACDGLYDITKPMMIPTSTNPFKKNQNTTQYYHFSWDVPTVWIKHPFGGGGWSYKQMTYNNDGTFSVDAEYSDGNGCDYGCQNNDNGKGGYIEKPTKTPNNTWSHLARFKMTFSGGSVKISITKLCKVTFNMNGHGSAIDAQNVLYNSKATRPSDPTASGYTFGGWYTDKNCTSAFDFNTAITDDKTLYAKWTATETLYTVAIKSAGNGSVSTNSVQAGSTTKPTITATPTTGYEFDRWEKEGGATVANATSATTTVSATAAGTITAYFKETMHTINVKSNNDTYGTVTPASVTAGVTGSGNIVAQPKTGYEFVKWTATSGITLANEKNATTTITKATAAGTVTATFQEKKHNVTVFYKCGTATIKDNTTTNNVGEVTSTTITAPDIYGYAFNSWELGNGITQKSVNGKSITITTKATGNYTLTAKYDEDLTTNWALAHTINSFSTTSHKFTKKTGESAGKVAYVSIDLAADTHYEFKVHNGNWYGNNNNNDGETYWIKNTVENWEFYNDAGNCHMKSSVAGTYTFNIDFSGSNPKVSVYFPTAYTVTYSRVPANAADAPTTNPSITSGGKVLSGTSITFSAKDAKNGYTWKGWYSNNTGEGNALTANKDYTTAITANTTIYAVYTANTYTVELNQEGATTAGTTSVTATYGAAMPNITIPTRTGYTFLGYWTGKEGEGTQYYEADGKSARNWDQTSNDILYAHWKETQYTITYGVHSTGHGKLLFENTNSVINGSGSSTSQQKHGTTISFVATPNNGYEIEGWYSDANCTKRIDVAGTYTKYSPAPITSNLTIYVKFKEETRRIYLKPTGDNDWKNGDPRYVVYIKNDGSGNEDTNWSKAVNMTKIDDGDSDVGNDIYYADILKKYTHVIFCRMNPGDNNNNWGNRWTQTKDLQLLEYCNLFDVNASASTESQYLADGKWMEYNAWQLVGSFAGWEPCGNRFDENSDGTYTLTIELTEGDYQFKLVRNGIWYGNSGTMERNGNGVQVGGWEMNQDHDCTIKADMTGNYIFTIHTNGKLTVTYPVTGYQLKISMNNGKVYTSNSVGNAGEILSFFAPGKDEPTDNAGVVKLCFEGKPIQTISSATFETSNVYVAKLNANKNGITDVALYDGNYYIRTDGAVGGWNNYKQDKNKMTYFVPRVEEKYSYYWVESVRHSDDNNRVNVKGCVGNQYNNDLAGMIEDDKFTDTNGDVYIIDKVVNGNINREKVNVRFGYNPKTNHFERAMLTGSGNMPNFLNITDPEGFLYKTNNQGKLETPLTTPNSDNKFTDVSNWVYERDVWVDVQGDQDVTVRLTAVAYNEETNSLFGFKDADQEEPTQRTIVGETSTQGPKKMRIIYDFKTNRMIMAWMPGEYNCTGEEALISDVLFMRHENNPVPQLTMTDTDDTDQITPQIKGIQSQFFALELENQQNKGGNYEEHYWITLPFNCVVGSISGVPGYMTVWGIQRYDGAERAQKGWFKETETFWKWLGPDDVMEAGVGYVLSFDKSAATWNTFDVHEEDENGKVINTTQKSLLRLYFPSTEKGFTFKSTNSFEKEYPNEPCTIQREDRYKQDGNWKIIGPISYNTATADPEYKTGEVWKPEEDGDHVDVSGKWSQPMFRYRYEYDNSTADKRKTEWKYIPEDGEKSVYQAFYGYLVQFAGLIKWSEISQSIHPRLRARTYTDQVPTNITTHLELVDADGVQHDQTFVALNIEGTTTYDLNKDLNKAFNSNFANIYTLSEGIPFAGNTLPMEKVTVPVGVRTATAGEYTFRMPDGTNGITVTLVDNATGTHTNMLMDEYTVTLDAGTIENRFYLVVDPDRTATSVENIGEEAKGQIKKFLIDGKLFIHTADGIFDAKGQRL